jgi:hypothetical protein
MLDDLTPAKEDAAGPTAVPAAPKTPVKGIAIVGSHPLTVASAPFGDPGWLIWACSPDNTPFGLTNARRQLPRVDDWFEIHDPIEHASRPFAYLTYVSGLPRVWMRDKRALASGLFPGGLPYPDEEMRGRKVFHPDGRIADYRPGRFHRSQFRSSIAFMMAKAIVACEEKGIPAIGLWGILQASDGEYKSQRISTQYFIEEAVKRGIRTHVAPESRLHHDDPEEF